MMDNSKGKIPKGWVCLATQMLNLSSSCERKKHGFNANSSAMGINQHEYAIETIEDKL